MNSRSLPLGCLGVLFGLVWSGASPANAQPTRVERSEDSGASQRGHGKVSLAPEVLARLPEPMRTSVAEVLGRPTLTVNGPEEVFPGWPALYYWFLDHPDRAAAAWRKLGAQCLDVTEVGDGRFAWKDDLGSDVRWQLIHSGPAMRVWYADGKYRPALLLPSVNARAVVMLHFQEGHDGAGRSLLRQHAELALYTDSHTAALAARLMGPSMPKLAQQYMGQIQLFFSGLVWYLDRHPERAAALLSPGDTRSGSTR